MDTSHVSSKHVKETPKHGSSLSEVDWGDLRKGTPKHGPSIMKVDWGGKIEANHTNGCMLCEVDWGAHETHTSGFMVSEVDWEAHHSSFFLYLEHIDHDGEPKNFFSKGLWGGLPQTRVSTHLMEYMKDSMDTGQMKMELPTPNQSRDTEVHILFLTLNTLELLNGT